MVLEAQQIEKVESEDRAGLVEARGRLAVRRDELISRLRAALEATAFSNRFLLPPRRLPQLAQAEAGAFLDFLETGDADRIREQGAKRAEEGLGEQAMLRLGTTLRQFCRDYPADGALRAADVYTDTLLDGFMAGREAIVLREQEQIRGALQRVISRYALQLTTAAEVSHAASSILDPVKLLPQVVNLIRDRFNLYYVGFFLLDESGEYAVLRAGSGAAGRQMLEMGHKLEVGGPSMIGWSTAHSQARIALDVGKEAVRFDNPLLPETRSEMALPLISRERVIGAMTIQSTRSGAFSEEDIAALRTMADQLANAIENARLFEQTQRQRQRAEILRETAEALNVSLKLGEVLATVLEQIRRVVSFDQACISRIEGGHSTIQCAIGYPDEAVLSSSVPVEALRGVHRVVQSGQPLLVPDVMASELAPPEDDTVPGRRYVRSWLGVPILVQGQVFAVICLDSYTANTYDVADRDALMTVANQAAVAIENAHLFEQTEAALAEVRQSKEFTETILNSMHDSISLIDVHDFRIVGANRTFLEEAGMEEEEVIGKFCYEITHRRSDPCTPPDDVCPLLDVRITDEPSMVEHVHYDKDGRKMHVEVSVSPVRGDKGEILQVVHVSRDITERKHAEAERGRLLTETENLAEELSVLNEMSRALAATLDVGAVIESTYHHTSRLMDTTNFYVALHDPQRNEVSFPLYAEGQRIRRVEPRRVGKGLTEYVLRTREPLLIEENVSARATELGCDPVGQEAQSWLGVPTTIGEQVTGVIAVQSYTTARLYDDHHRDLLSAVASQAAIAIENARLFERTQAALAETETLYRANRAIAVARTADDVLRAFTDHVVAPEMGRCVLALIDPASRPEEPIVEIAAAWEPGVERPAVLGNRWNVSQIPLIATMATEPLAISDVATSPQMDEISRRVFLNVLHIEAVAIVPLLVGERPRGWLLVESLAGPYEFSEREMRLYWALAGQAGVALERMRLFEQIQARAERERAIREISDQMQRATDVEALMRITVEELNRALGGSRAYVRLGAEPQSLSGDDGQGA